MKQWLNKILQSPWEKRLFPICLIIGVIFLVVSNTNVSESNKEDAESKNDAVMSKSTSYAASYEERLEDRLESTLSMLEGVGRVEVMLICKDQGKVLVEKDTSYSSKQTIEEDSGGGSRTVTEEEAEESVIYDEDSHPFISMEESPTVQGALVLAEGADSSIIQQQLIQSVSVLLDLSASKIQVLPYENESNP